MHVSACVVLACVRRALAARTDGSGKVQFSLLRGSPRCHRRTSTRHSARMHASRRMRTALSGTCASKTCRTFLPARRQTAGARPGAWNDVRAVACAMRAAVPAAQALQAIQPVASCAAITPDRRCKRLSACARPPCELHCRYGAYRQQRGNHAPSLVRRRGRDHPSAPNGLRRRHCTFNRSPAAWQSRPIAGAQGLRRARNCPASCTVGSTPRTVQATPDRWCMHPAAGARMTYPRRPRFASRPAACARSLGKPRPLTSTSTRVP